MTVDLSHLEGEVLDESFHLEALAGQGGFGAVFRGTQLSVGRTCGVKVLAPELATKDNSVERFEVEARATARLTHPHTVVVFDFGRAPGHSVLFLAMEWLDGRDLRVIVDRFGPLTRPATAQILEQVAGSLREAHGAGMVHRDVKPRNAMVVDRGERELFTKVIDFGIAKAFAPEVWDGQTLTKTGRMVGTPSYMAPEQIRGDSVDGRTDQYAAAVTAHYLLTGRKPIEGEGPMETVANQLQTPPTPLSDHRDDIDPGSDLEAVLLKAMSKRPEHRFGTIGDFATAVSEAVGSAGREEEGGGGLEFAPDRAVAEETTGLTTRADLAGVPQSMVGGSGGADTAVASGRAAETAPETVAEDVAPVSAHGSAGRGRDESPGTARSGAESGVVEGAGAAQSSPNGAGPPAEETPGPRTLWSVVGGMAVVGVVTGVAAHWASRGEADPESDGRPAAVETTSSEESGRRPGPAESTRGSSAGRSAEPDAEADTVERETTVRRRQRSGSEPSRESSSEEIPVVVIVKPWGDVYIDGEKRGQGGRTTVELEPGRHRVVVRQGESRVVARRRVRVEPGGPNEFEFSAMR